MSAATVKQYCSIVSCELCVLFCDFRGGHVEKQEKQQTNEKMKPKVRRHHTSKSDEPDLQESAFLKKIIAYQRKLLVQGDFLPVCFNSLSPTVNMFTQFEQMLLTGSVDSEVENTDSRCNDVHESWQPSLKLREIFACDDMSDDVNSTILKQLM